MPELLSELQQLSSGLLFMSESDAPFEVQELHGPGELEAAIGGRPVKTETLAHFFRNAVKHQEWHSEAERETVLRYQALQQFLENHLQDLQVLRAGETEIDVWINGHTDDGRMIGLHTRVVES